MSRIIDADKLDIVFRDSDADGWSYEYITRVIEEQPTILAIPIDKVKALVEQLDEEQEYAYADFEEYKEIVLGIERDELPEDEFRYGVERCMQLLNKLIAESEKV